jgi:DNA modification methylase
VFVIPRSRRIPVLIRRIPISKINPAPYNPRKDLKPGDSDYAKLERSIDEFGCVEPLVWNKQTGHLVGGHQRFKILIARGAAHVDVSVVDLPLAQEQLLNIALNRVGGDWDRDKLAQLLDDLSKAPDLDLGLSGFDSSDTEALIAGVLESTGDGERFDTTKALAPGLPVITKPGDLILLGRDARLQHRLLCGDCTDAAQVRRLMGKERAALFATDPPYLVNYDGCNHPGVRATRNKDWSGSYCVEGANWDDPALNPELYERFAAVAAREALRPEAPWYCWHASRNQSMLEAAWAKVGVLAHQQIIWVKNRGVLTRSWYTWQHEPCLMGWLKGHRPRRRGGWTDRSLAGAGEQMRSSVWHIEGIGPERPDHPTPKPVELFAIPIRQHTRSGEVCYEPFAGSGTQIIAAQRLKRRCFALEISPRYCDLIVRRFIAAAGAEAVEPALARRYRLRGAAA